MQTPNNNATIYKTDELLLTSIFMIVPKMGYEDGVGMSRYLSVSSVYVT